MEVRLPSVSRSTWRAQPGWHRVVPFIFQGLFSAGLLVLTEKIFLRYDAINFHRKALADRLAENKLGLRALDRLSNAQPAPQKAPYAGKKGHRSRGSNLDMLGMDGGGEKGNGAERSSGSVSPTDAKQENKRTKRQRKNIVAAVIVDQLGGALEQVTQDQFRSLASAGKLARKLFSTLSDVHPIVDSMYRACIVKRTLADCGGEHCDACQGEGRGNGIIIL